MLLLMKNVRISKLTKLQSQKNSRSRGNTRKNCKKQEGFYGHEIEMYTVEQGEKRDKRQ